MKTEARNTTIKHIKHTDPLNITQLLLKLFGVIVFKRLWTKPQTTRSL